MSETTTVPGAGAVRYVPGAGAVVVRAGVLVALPDAPLDAAAAVWRALDGAPGVMDVLQAVADAFGTGLAALPAFAALVGGPARAQVLVRGAVEVVVEPGGDGAGGAAGAAGLVVLDGSDVTTWVERTVPAPRGVVVRLGHHVLAARDAAASDALLPFDGGVVLADAVVVGSPTSRDAAGPSVGADPAAAGAVVEGAVVGAVVEGAVPAAGTVAQVAASVVAASGDWPLPVVPVGPVAAEVAALAGSGSAGPDALAGSGSIGAVAPAPGDPAVPADPAGDGAGAEPASPETIADFGTILPSRVVTDDATDDGTGPDDQAASGRGADAPSTDAPSVDAAPADVPAEPLDDYGALWETTIHRSVEEAAVRPDEGEDLAAPGLVAGVPTTFPPVPAPPSDGSRDADVAPGPGASSTAAPGTAALAATPGTAAPGTAAPAMPGTAAPAAPDGLDHDGHTVVSSALASLRAVAAAAAASAGEPASGAAPGATPDDGATPAAARGPEPSPGPVIVGRACASGHANPPSREACSVCGGPLSSDTRSLPRPALGRVRVSSGQVLDLDRPLVVGRRPRSPRGAAPGEAGPPHRVVTVDSPQQDISRSHVEVRLEGWNVLAVDLNTTNGTTLLRGGQPPLRMHPGEPVLVVSGDVVDLGDGATLAFEDLP